MKKKNKYKSVMAQNKRWNKVKKSNEPMPTHDEIMGFIERELQKEVIRSSFKDGIKAGQTPKDILIELVNESMSRTNEYMVIVREVVEELYPKLLGELDKLVVLV